MALRTVALCGEQRIGIESIFTVVSGRQINLSEKVEALRELGRRNRLFCPCGCGANLVLVAGDHNLREQHFRVRGGKESCHFLTESKCSIASKIVSSICFKR